MWAFLPHGVPTGNLGKRMGAVLLAGLCVHAQRVSRALRSDCHRRYAQTVMRVLLKPSPALCLKTVKGVCLSWVGDHASTRKICNLACHNCTLVCYNMFAYRRFTTRLHVCLVRNVYIFAYFDVFAMLPCYNASGCEHVRQVLLYLAGRRSCRLVTVLRQGSSLSCCCFLNVYRSCPYHCVQ